MDDTVITAFSKATIDTFKTMVSLDVFPRKALTEEEKIAGKGVHAIIGMSGEIEGAAVLSMSDEIACNVIGEFIGDVQTEITSEVVDGVQELINIIIGAAKTPLVEGGLEFAFGLPKTMVGLLFSTDEGPDFNNLSAVFNSTMGEFRLGLTWKIERK